MQGLFARLRALLDPNRPGGVSHFELNEAMRLLNEAELDNARMKALLEAASLYLYHPDVKAIPFAMRSEVLAEKILAALTNKETE